MTNEHDEQSNPANEAPDAQSNANNQHAHDQNANDQRANAGARTRRADRFEEQFRSVNFSFQSVCDAMKDVERQAADALYTLVPPEVTQHLVNSQKELLKAGARLGEVASERVRRFATEREEELNYRAARAREVHEKMRAEREAAKAAQATSGPAPEATA